MVFLGINAMFKRAVRLQLSQPECRGLILDGARTLEQLQQFEQNLKEEELELGAAVELHVDIETTLSRLASRLVHPASGRVYNLETNPPKVSATSPVPLNSIYIFFFFFFIMTYFFTGRCFHYSDVFNLVVAELWTLMIIPPLTLQVAGRDDITGEPLAMRKGDNNATLKQRYKVWEDNREEVTNYLKESKKLCTPVVASQRTELVYVSLFHSLQHFLPQGKWQSLQDAARKRKVFRHSRYIYMYIYAISDLFIQMCPLCFARV